MKAKSLLVLWLVLACPILGQVVFHASNINGFSTNGAGGSAPPSIDWACVNVDTNTDFSTLCGTMRDITICNCGPYLGPLSNLTNSCLTNITGTFSLTCNDQFSLQLPGLLTANTIDIHQSQLTNVVISALTRVTNDFGIYDSPNLKHLSAPDLVWIGNNVQLSGLTGYISVDLPVLATVGGLFVFGEGTNTTSINLPSLVTVGRYLDFNGHTILTSLSLPALKGLSDAFFGDGINVSNCALDSTSINGILHTLVGCTNLTGGTWGNNTSFCHLEGGSNASPSGAGITDKATLVARGVNVSNN